MKIKYIGHLRVCSVNIKGTIEKYWGKGEVREIAEGLAKKLLRDNVDFVRVEDEKIEEVKKLENEEKLEFDITGDGVVDEKDVSLAARVLRSKRKK